MKTKRITMALLFVMSFTGIFGQNQNSSKTSGERKFSVSTPYLSFLNFGDEKTNTHHYELHVKYMLSDKDVVGIKMASWKLFAPMGIQLWDPQFMDESEFYPGRLSEKGIGFTYQRFLWKGLFASAEILPLYKTYLDEEKNEIGNGFKMYTTWHLGYQITLFKNRMFIEPQVHCNYWPIDPNTPQSFKEMDDKWSNYFLLEPNIYIGFKF